jgi:hypothetical protein
MLSANLSKGPEKHQKKENEDNEQQSTPQSPDLGSEASSDKVGGNPKNERAGDYRTADACEAARNGLSKSRSAHLFFFFRKENIFLKLLPKESDWEVVREPSEAREESESATSRFCFRAV